MPIIPTPNESAVLIWVLLGLISILVFIGWYYIQASIKEQKETAKNIFEIRLMLGGIVKDITAINKETESFKTDTQDVKEDIEVLRFRTQEIERTIANMTR